MNKKLAFIIASAVGIVSVFLPWFTVFGLSISAVNGPMSDGVIIALFFAAILGLTVWEEQPESLRRKRDIIAIVLSVLVLLILLYHLTKGGEIASYGVSMGLGFYLAFLASAFILGYSIYERATHKSEENQSDESEEE